MPKTVTPAVAALHEAVYLRLAVLARQTEASANRRPDAPVNATTRRAAEAVMFDARAFTGTRAALPVAAPDMAGLATQLGQLLAALDDFEARHTHWNPIRKCFLWSVRGTALVPVARLKPKIEPAETLQDRQEILEVRRKLAYRLDQQRGRI